MPLDLTQLWTETPIVVFDTETTGLSNTDDICEVAACRFERGVLVAEYATLVKPRVPISQESAYGRPGTDFHGHGITNAMVANSPCLEEAASGLYRVAIDAVPCAFNGAFDRRFFHKRVAGTDCPLFDPEQAWIDVYTIVSSPRVDKFHKGRGRLKLGACCTRHGVTLEGAHRAVGDARATGALLWRLHEKGLVKSCSLQRLLEWGAVRRKEQNEDHVKFRQKLREKAAQGGDQP